MADKEKEKTAKAKEEERPAEKEVDVKENAVKKKESEEKPKKDAKKSKDKGSEEEKEENISKSLVDQVKEGIVKEDEEKEEKADVQATPKKSEFIALVHVHASKNNTIVTVTDLSGAETFASYTGGMVAKSGREEKTPFAAAQMARRASNVLKERGCRKVDVLLRGKGGHRGQKSPGRAGSSVIKILARSGIKIRKIEDVTPIPHGGSKPPGGKRGRRV